MFQGALAGPNPLDCFTKSTNTSCFAQSTKFSTLTPRGVTIFGCNAISPALELDELLVIEKLELLMDELERELWLEFEELIDVVVELELLLISLERACELRLTTELVFDEEFIELETIEVEL